MLVLITAQQLTASVMEKSNLFFFLFQTTVVYTGVSYPFKILLVCIISFESFTLLCLERQVIWTHFSRFQTALNL